MEDILTKWHESKQKIDILEKRIEKYKDMVTKEMNSKKTDKISAGSFTVTRRKNTRTFLSKDLVPENIWKQYSKKSNYDALYLTTKKH